ncbi:GH25 family lysozyme [Escherichia coli]
MRLFLQTVDFSQGDFPAVLDVEERGKLSAKRITQEGKSVAKNGRKSTGKKPIIYSGAVFITRIWRAISMNIRGGWLTTINVVRTMTEWRRFWQHSERGQVDGINGPVDFNVFNGTVEELQGIR